jgi:asparagine synthase (glutamine-hydrolysing)
MPGIVAIYDPQGRTEQIANLVPQMCMALRTDKCLPDAPCPRADHERQIEWFAGLLSSNQGSGPCFGMGRHRPALINRSPQPIWNETGTVCLVFHGELYGYDDVRRAVERKGHSLADNTPSAAATVIHLYEENGEAFVHELNGSFSLVLWDSRRKRLIVANDRYGLRPLYHGVAGDTHIWASSPQAMLAHPAFYRPNINLAALADFLSMGALQGNDTILEGIDEVPPGSLVICQQTDGVRESQTHRHVHHRQYWDLAFQEDETRIPADDYVAELIRLLKQAAERRQADGLGAGLLLSGGHDSRVALSVLGKSSLKAFTFGVPHCDDIRFAQQAAQASHVPFTALEIRPDYLRTFARAGIRRTEDLISCNMFHGISVYDQVASQVNALITGSAGEDIFGHFARDPDSEFWGAGFSVDRYYDTKKIMTDADLEQLLNPIYGRTMLGLARARFHRDFERYSSRHTTHIVDYWSIKQQQRRLYNRLSSLFPDNLEFRPLYYDNDVIDFVQTVPHSMRWGQGSIYKQVLRGTAPELVRIPFTTTQGLSLDADRRQVARRKEAGTRWRRWHRKMDRLTRGRLPPLRRPSLYTHYNTWFRHELRDWAESILLDAQTLERGYWNATTLRRMVRNHAQGRPMTKQLAAILSFELWHRTYLDGQCAERQAEQPSKTPIHGSSSAGYDTPTRAQGCATLCKRTESVAQASVTLPSERHKARRADGLLSSEG